MLPNPLVLPPVHFGHQLRTKGNGGNSGGDAAVAADEMLTDPPPDIRSGANICYIVVPSRSAIHSVHGWRGRQVSDSVGFLHNFHLDTSTSFQCRVVSMQVSTADGRDVHANCRPSHHVPSLMAAFAEYTPGPANKHRHRGSTEHGVPHKTFRPTPLEADWIIAFSSRRC